MSELRRKPGRPRKPKRAPPLKRKSQAIPTLPFAAERRLLAGELQRVPVNKGPASTTSALVVASAASGDVAHLPVRLPGIRLELATEQLAIAMKNLQDFAEHGVTGLASNSQRTMRSDWLNWLAFCRHTDSPALPIAFRDLREFLDTLIQAKRKRSTIEHHLYTLRQAAAFYGCPDPMQSPVAKAWWRDTCRDTLKAAKRQAKGLVMEDVEKMVANLDLEVPRQARDAALVLMAYDLMARRSELTEARWEDMELPNHGLGNYTVPRSKTDQEGEGTILSLGEATVTALRAWREHAHPELPYVFQPMQVKRHQSGALKGEVIVRPLDAGEIPKIWNRLAKAAGVDVSKRGFSGHSARVGAAQDLTAGGGDLPLLMKLGRWKSPVQPARYGEAGLAAAAHEQRQEILARRKVTG